MIEEAYVSFEVAKLLKERGFDEYGTYFYTLKDEGCEGYKSNRTLGEFAHNSDPNLKDRAVSCPTHQMAMAWLREVHYLWIDIDPLTNYKWTWSIWLMNDPNFKMGESSQVISLYEEAVEAALKYALENLI